MSVEQQHALVVVAGRKDTKEGMKSYQRMTSPFSSYGFEVSVHRVGWIDNKTSFVDALGAVSNKIEGSLLQGKNVSLLGVSAGGVMALDAFMEFPEITSVVTVGSRLQMLSHERPQLSFSMNPLLRTAIQWLEEHGSYLTADMRRRVMTTMVRSGDDYLSRPATLLSGARNVIVPYDATDHNDGVVKTLAGLQKPIAVFLRGSRV